MAGIRCHFGGHLFVSSRGFSTFSSVVYIWARHTKSEWSAAALFDAFDGLQPIQVHIFAHFRMHSCSQNESRRATLNCLLVIWGVTVLLLSNLYSTSLLAYLLVAYPKGEFDSGRAMTQQLASANLLNVLVVSAERPSSNEQEYIFVCRKAKRLCKTRSTRAQVKS